MSNKGPGRWMLPMRSQSKVLVLVSLIVISGWNCSPRSQSVRPECPSSDAEDYFFPIGPAYPTQSHMGRSGCDGCSIHLRAMQEPSLSCGKSTAESTYRFLWLRTFDHPISVRVEVNGSTSVLHAVELDGAGGYTPGKVLKRVERALSPAEQEELMAKLNGIRFWGMKTSIDDQGVDGASWILEGVRDGRYHVVDRWSPESGDYREACLFFLELAGLTPSNRIY
jgi:hypothetical protein